MNKLKMPLLLAVALAAPAIAASAPAPATNTQGPLAREAPTRAELEAKLKRIADQLTPQTGDTRIPSAEVVLHLGTEYYFLPAEQAKSVLADAWGNPPETVSNVLGIVFPAGKTFVDDTWGAVITFQPTGYVSDEDAESTDYNELLEEIQESEATINARRVDQGYPAQHLVGWAQQPAYDRATHSVVWAQNIQVAGDPENWLNYDIRLLGRRGVLSLNMVTVMSKLAETREAAQRFAKLAEFQPGARYADYSAGDHTAEYGVAGLVATGVGAAAAKKVGLLAVLLIFLKKFGVLLIAGLAGLVAVLRRMFKREEDAPSYGDEPYADAEPSPANGSTEAAPVLDKGQGG
jgi:uncharacterized membrane-anchored protein